MLNWISDEFFDFLRRQSGGGSDDLYLIVGDVRQCVNGQSGQREDASKHQSQREQAHDELILYAEKNDFIKH